MVSVCLPSDALLQHLPSYLGFSYLGRGVSLHGCSSKAQPLLLTLDKGYLLTAALPDLQCVIAPLGPPTPSQPGLLGRGVGPPSHRPSPPPLALGLGAWGSSSRPWPLASGMGAWGSSSRPPLLTSDAGYLLLAAPPDLGRGVIPLGCRPSGMGSSRLLPLTSDVGCLLSAALWRACRSRLRYGAPVAAAFLSHQLSELLGYFKRKTKLPLTTKRS